MTKMFKNITISAAMGLGMLLGGIFIGENIVLNRRVDDLEASLKTRQVEIGVINQENYQLHLELIRRGNPYGWELWGDASGDWGYRKADENVILGTSGDGYIYLTREM